jgi:hypothetical protein
LSGTASVSLHIEPALQLLLYGVAGPQLSLTTGLDFNANTATTPWWTLTAPLEVDASLTAPDLGLSSGNLVLYQKNPPFLIAQATTAPAAPPPAPPAPKVPSSGPTLIYQFDTAGNESEDLSFDDWAAATGQDADTEATLPTDLSSYRCVVLDLNQSFASGDEAALSSYLQAGGTILVLGEHTDYGGDFDNADSALNAMVGDLGSTITLNDDDNDQGDTYTSNIDSSPLTSGVSLIAYNWASSLSLSSTAEELVASADDSYSLIAAQPVGGGTIVVSGDSNVFSDNSDGFYDEADNGQLVDDLCP